VSFEFLIVKKMNNPPKKLCVFPNDPIKSYFEKGEIKSRYYNPKNFFDEVHIISFTDSDIDEEKVSTIAGDAVLKIHAIGKIRIKERERHVDHIVDLVKEICPDVIRSYNPYLEGWFAAKCSEKLNIPFLLSLHTQYDHNRKLAMKTNLKKFFALKYTEKYIEPFVLKKADKIIIVFRIIEPYVIKHNCKKPEVLYNKIDYKKFEESHVVTELLSPLVISVGNLIKEKNHQCIIKAMKNVNAYCLIIGKGKEYENIMKLIKKEKLEGKVIIKNMVPYDEIQNYYRSAKVFALAYDPNLEGLPMPVIEAMATGIPVVIPEPNKEFSDGLENIAVFAKRTPNSFAEKISKLLSNENFYNEVSVKCKNKALEFDQEKIEKREKEIYEELITKNSS